MSLEKEESNLDQGDVAIITTDKHRVFAKGDIVVIFRRCINGYKAVSQGNIEESIDTTQWHYTTYKELEKYHGK